MIKIKPDLVVLDRNPYDDTGKQPFEAKAKLPSEDLLDVVKRGKYRKVAYNFLKYTKDDNRIIKLLAKRSGTELIDTSQSSEAKSEEIDIVIEGRHYLNDLFIESKYAEDFRKDNVAFYVVCGDLKPAIVLGDISLYTEDSILELIEAERQQRKNKAKFDRLMEEMDKEFGSLL